MSDEKTSWSQAFQRLITEPGRKPERPKPFNPNPPGVVRRGSASHVIFDFLQECQGRQFTAQELIRATGLSRAAASFGLHYLSRTGQIDAIPDGSRNEKWFLYSAKKGAQLKTSGSVASAREVRLVRDEKAMPEPKESRLEPLRGGWYRDLPAVEDLRTVPEGHGVPTHPKALAWAKRRAESLHPEQLHLDRAGPTATSADVLPSSAPEGRAVNDGFGGSAAARNARLLGCAKSSEERVQPGVATTQEVVPRVDLDHLARTDLANSGMGPTPGDLAECALVAPSQRDDAGKGDVGTDADPSSEVSFQQGVSNEQG